MISNSRCENLYNHLCVTCFMLKVCFWARTCDGFFLLLVLMVLFLRLVSFYETCWLQRRKGSCWLEPTDPISVLFLERSPYPLSLSSPVSIQKPRASVFMRRSLLQCFSRLISWLQVCFLQDLPTDLELRLVSLQLLEDWQTCATASKFLFRLLQIFPYLVARSKVAAYSSDSFFLLVVDVQIYLREFSYCGYSVRFLSPSRSASKKGCSSASSAVIRSLGSILSSPLMKLSPFEQIFPKYFFSRRSRFWISGNFMPRKRWFLMKRSWRSAGSAPSDFWMRKSWSSSFSPGNNGFPSMSSHMMQATAHMSMARPYSPPTSSSGGRYQRVATQSVTSSSRSALNWRAKPKSQILRRCYLLTSRFSGLMSRCTMFCACRQASPFSSWQTSRRMTPILSPPWAFYSTSSRLFSRYSKTRQTMPFLRKASLSSTMLGCPVIFRIFTSRIVVFLVCSSSSHSLNFLIATKQLDSMSRHFSTTPYAPSPIADRIQYFCMIINLLSIIIKLYGTCRFALPRARTRLQRREAWRRVPVGRGNQQE